MMMIVKTCANVLQLNVIDVTVEAAASNRMLL